MIKNKVDEHSVIEQRLKQAGVSSFTRYVITVYAKSYLSVIPLHGKDFVL